MTNLNWTSNHEDLLIDWADKAKCYKWLHNRAQRKYNCLASWFTIPVIILSTATGTANFAQYRIEDTEVKSFAPLVLGCINICTGIVTTVQQFLKINELNEAHRVSSIGWDKLYRNIKVEISKPIEVRCDIDILIKHCQEEYDRLMETSPDITEDVLESFYRTFTENKTRGCLCCGADTKVTQDELIAFNRIKKPEICGIMQTTADFRHQRTGDISTQTEVCIPLSEINKISFNTKKDNQLPKDQEIGLEII